MNLNNKMFVRTPITLLILSLSEAAVFYFREPTPEWQKPMDIFGREDENIDDRNILRRLSSKNYNRKSFVQIIADNHEQAKKLLLVQAEEKKEPALLFAARTGNIGCLRLLLGEINSHVQDRTEEIEMDEEIRTVQGEEIRLTDAGRVDEEDDDGEEKVLHKDLCKRLQDIEGVDWDQLKSHVDVRGGGIEATALMIAVFFGKKKAVELLIQNGADVNAQDIRGMTPLMFASYAPEPFSQHKQIAEYLLKKGANLYQVAPRSCKFSNAFHVALASENDGSLGVMEVLLNFSENLDDDIESQNRTRNKKKPKRNIHESPPDADSPPSERTEMTPVMIVSSLGYDDKLRLLHAHGAKLTGNEKNGKSAFGLACEARKNTTAILIASLDVETYMELNNIDEPQFDHGNTMLCAQKNLRRVFEYLAYHPPDVNKLMHRSNPENIQLGDSFDSALIIACKAKQWKIAAALIDGEADPEDSYLDYNFYPPLRTNCLHLAAVDGVTGLIRILEMNGVSLHAALQNKRVYHDDRARQLLQKEAGYRDCYNRVYVFPDTQVTSMNGISGRKVVGMGPDKKPFPDIISAKLCHWLCAFQYTDCLFWEWQPDGKKCYLSKQAPRYMEFFRRKKKNNIITKVRSWIRYESNNRLKRTSSRTKQLVEVRYSGPKICRRGKSKNVD